MKINEFGKTKNGEQDVYKRQPLDYFEEFFEKQNGRKMSEKQRNYLLEILGEAREESHETN